MANRNSIAPKNQGPTSVQPYYPDVDSGYGYDHFDAGGNQSQKHQILRLLAVIQRYWYLIVGIPLVATTLVFVYEAQKPDLYIAESKIQVNNETNPATGGPGNPVILNQSSDPAYFATQLRILESEGLLRRVVKGIDLEHNDSFLNPKSGNRLGFWDNILRSAGLNREIKSAKEMNGQQTGAGHLDLSRETIADLDSQAEKLGPYVGQIERGLKIAPVRDSRSSTKETRLIAVSYSHQDPAIAAKVANAIADIYVLQNLERKVETNATTSDFLEKRVAELRSQIRSSEERLINYSRGNQLISLDERQNTVVQRLGDLNGKLGAAENDRISAEAAYRAAKQNPMSGTVAENTDTRTVALESQLTALRQQLAQLKTEYTDDWPDVQRVRKQMAQVESELQANKKRAQDTQSSLLEQRYREAVDKERELRTDFEVQRNAVLQQNEAAINYRIIQQEIDTNRELLSGLLQKSKETDVILNGTPNNVLVADRASAPQSPSEPNRSRNVLMALAVSLLLGLGLAFAINWLDDRITVFDDAESQIGVPVVGMIPGIHQGFVRRLMPARRQLNGDSDSSRVPINFDRPIVTEAFNNIRASLLLSDGGSTSQIVLVTSGQPSEGKTLTAFSLAKCLAQLGDKVLLIDADLRCPQMHIINGLTNDLGLSNLLKTNGGRPVGTDEAIVSDISENLDLMTAGPAVADPATLFSVGKMRSLLDRLGTSYRYIVIDSPPALYFADSIMLANHADSVLLVGRMNYSSTELLTLTKKKLQNVNANIVGVVLNDIPLKSYGYSKNGYYVNETEISRSNGNGDHHENGSNGSNGNGKMLDLS